MHIQGKIQDVTLVEQDILVPAEPLAQQAEPVLIAVDDVIGVGPKDLENRIKEATVPTAQLHERLAA